LNSTSSIPQDNMTIIPGKALDLDQIKALEVGILDAFDAFCSKHQLTYWLGYGTLLGAIRHKGFIPWDDDIDLLIPEEDYHRLIELINAGETISDHHRASDPGIAGDTCHMPFCKIYDTRTTLTQNELISGLNVDEGVWIDIFPLYGLPEDPEQAKRLLHRFYWLYLKNRLACFRRNPGGSLAGSLARTLLKVPTKIMGYRYYLKVMGRLARSLPAFADSKRVFTPVEPSDIFNRQDFDQTVQVEFEGKMYPAPAGFDAHLTDAYGDYMQLPPEDQRVSMHDFNVSWR